jgi:uncharacterized protein (TIGR03067 family)
MKHLMGLLAVSAALLLAAATRAGDGEKKELEKFTGSWAATAVTVDGKELPAERVKAVRLEVKGNQYTYTAGKEVIKGTHKLDPGKKPKAIDAMRATGEGKGETLKGIYELDDDTFKVCFAAPGKDRPTEFSAKEGSGRRLIVMKRVKKGG